MVGEFSCQQIGHGKVTVSEFNSVVQGLVDEADKGPIYYISQSNDSKIPMGSYKTAQAFLAHPNNRHVASTPESLVGQYVLQLIARGKYSWHKTLEDAIAFVEAKVAQDQSEA